MDLDELQSVQSRERQTDSLQQLRATFYQDAAAYVQSLEEERTAAAERADDPWNAPEVGRLNDDIDTAQQTVEAIYERRVGKIVKMASLAAADMPTEDEGLTEEERKLFDTLVAAIEQNRDHVFAILDGDDAPPTPAGLSESAVPAQSGPGEGSESAIPRESHPQPDEFAGNDGDAAADSGTTPAPDGPVDTDAPDGPVDADAPDGADGPADGTRVDAAELMSTGGPAGTDGSGTDGSGATGTNDSDAAGGSSSSSEESRNGSDAAPPGAASGSGDPETGRDSTDPGDDGTSRRSDGGTAVRNPDPSSSPSAEGGSGSEEDSDASPESRETAVDRSTVRITAHVGEIFGVDERAYDLTEDDVVTLPEPNAGPLVERDAAERLD